MHPHCAFVRLVTTIYATAICSALIAEELSPERPAWIGPDGKDKIAITFTTKAYQKEAFRLVLQEANEVARDLKLPEKLPITEEDLVAAFIGPYGYTQRYPKSIGNVSTRDYVYCVSLDHKLCFVEGNHQHRDIVRWSREYRWPRSQIDTNGAYQLATQWLAAASMDVAGLNRDCGRIVEIYTDLNPVEEPEEGKFVPVYDVYWLYSPPHRSGSTFAAVVRVFAPTKTLVSLRVQESKYILRKPLVFTNLNALLSEPEKR